MSQVLADLMQVAEHCLSWFQDYHYQPAIASQLIDLLACCFLNVNISGH
jgi:hypothetical protein